MEVGTRELALNRVIRLQVKEPIFIVLVGNVGLHGTSI